MPISTLADVSSRATIGRNVEIGPFTVIHDDVVIGDDVVIQSHCAIGIPTPLADGAPLVIGDGAIVRSHNLFYQGSTFGPGLRTGHQVSAREKLRVGEDFQAGTLVDLQGNATIGRHVRVYNGSHIAQGSTVGDFVWIFPYVVFTNDPHPPSDGFLTGPTVEDYAVIATRATVLPGVVIGTDSLVGAGSLVSKDVPPSTFVSGMPAKKVALTKYIPLRDGSGPAYPWRRHFHRGFPEDVVAAWVAETEASAGRRG